jgi:hypothetical protein
MIQIHERVGADGVLKLAIPLPGDANKDVVVTIQTVPGNHDVAPTQKWRDFLDATYGSCADLRVERGLQGPYETREPLD